MSDLKTEEKNEVVTLSQEEKTWGMLTHILAFAGFIGIPLGNILGPLVMWIIKKNESPFIDKHGKQALNFQISMTIYALVSAVLIVVLIGFVLVGIVAVIDIVFVIKAAIAANKGEDFEYPFTIKFLK
jgi:uncharacterized Tic20 family protein